MGKSPVKLQFPTFGKPNDTSDPLQYLEWCEDFLALNPLTDEELIATLRNVLHGTARDWWDVGHHKVHTWKEFHDQFRAAFLSEDYEDELAERVRNRVQGESESVRDFAYMYQSLCKCWKPNIEEDEIIKLILKNINPQLASQLRSSRVTSVDGLVRLGQQLEKDRENQLQYEQRRGLLRKPSKPVAPESAALPPNRENPVQPSRLSHNRPLQVYCCRCKGSHAPASCSQWNSNRASSPRTSHQQAAKTSQIQEDPPTLGSLIHSSYLGETTSVNPSSLPLQSPLPCPLMVPLNIGPWTGTAILDTGLSYTLINEDVWKGMRAQQDALKPWTRGPLYLADGEGRQPLEWSKMTLALQSQPVTLTCVILPAHSLVFPAVVGLDFIFLSGLQFDVSENRYWFKSNKKRQYQFLRESAARPNTGLPPQLAFFSAIAPSDLVPLPPCHDLLQAATCNTHLDDFGKNLLLCQLQKNSDVCTAKLGCTSVLTHKIFLTHEVPIKQKPYCVPPSKLQMMKELVEEMLEKDIIEPSASPYAAPVVLIPKKQDPRPRFCVDYRKVNAATHTDAYPLPNIQEILESLAGAVVFTTLDLNSGYWQVQIDKESRGKTAFICPFGLYQFKVMPFGLKNAPATFQRLMELVLRDLQGKTCFVYLDGIIIYSDTFEQHSYDLQAVLDKLREANLTVNMKKSQFFRTSLKFLGHVVSSAGVEVDAEKTVAIQNFPVPQNIKELQKFLGLAGWYHRFVPRFSQLTEPLNAFKRNGAKFLWTSSCQVAFEALKQHLVSPPILGHPDFNLPFIVYTDASDVGLGALLA